MENAPKDGGERVLRGWVRAKDRKTALCNHTGFAIEELRAYTNSKEREDPGLLLEFGGVINTREHRVHLLGNRHDDTTAQMKQGHLCQTIITK